jgi:hypothetical protein
MACAPDDESCEVCVIRPWALEREGIEGRWRTHWERRKF